MTKPRHTLPILRGLLLGVACSAALVAIWPSLAGPLPWNALHPERRLVLAAAVVLLLLVRLPERWLERLVPLALTSVMALCICELALRIALREEFGRKVILDDYLLYRILPNAKSTFRHLPANGQAVIHVRYDSLGNRASSVGNQQNSHPLLVFGDSFIAAEFSEDTATFTERLGSLLRKRNGDLSGAVNAGVVGYGPDQVLLRIPAALDLIRPSRVVIAVFAGNDFGDVLRNRLFRLDSAGRLQGQHAALDESIRRQEMSANSRWYLAKLVFRIRNSSLPLDTSATENATRSRQLVETWRQERSVEFVQAMRGDTVVTNLYNDTPDVDIQIDPAATSSRYKLDLTAAVLDSIRTILVGKSIPLTVVIIPSAIDIMPGYDGGVIDPARYPAYHSAFATAALASRLRRRGIRSIDLFPAFSVYQGVPLYFRGGDNHWTDAAQSLAAKIVADSLMATASVDTRSSGPDLPVVRTDGGPVTSRRLPSSY